MSQSRTVLTCQTCNSPVGLVRILQLYDVGLFKCEACRCEVCLHMETGRSQGEAAKHQGASSSIAPRL